MATGLEEGQRRAEALAKAQFEAGPMVEADGLLKLPYIGILWAFSPAYPSWLASVIPQKDYWGVVQV